MAKSLEKIPRRGSKNMGAPLDKIYINIKYYQIFTSSSSFLKTF
jgi:hypothetical protein